MKIFQNSNTIPYVANCTYHTNSQGDAGVPDGIMSSTVYIRSQTLWKALKLED
jgi:hypothetical protein